MVCPLLSRNLCKGLKDATSRQARPLPLILSVSSYVLFRNPPRNMLGEAENNHRIISSVPVVYTAGLHVSESGEGHIVANKREADCILLIMS